MKQDCAGAWWTRGPIANYPPTNTSDYADFTRWFVARYGTNLAAVEVWNEPNYLPNQGSQYWKTTNPVGDYIDLLKAAYPAIKAVNAQLPVLAGSISGNDRTFLSALYSAGVKNFSDAISIHPYNDTGFSDLKLMRAIQTNAGDTSPIWITEFGFPTGTSSQWHVSETEQANLITTSFNDLNNLAWVKAAIVYNLRNKGTDPNTMEDNFGLIRRDYTPKPAYGALKNVLSGSATSTRAPRPRRLSLRTVRKSGHVFALLAAKPQGRVRLSVRRCARARRSSVITVRLNRRGRAVRRIGTARALAGCRLSARLV